MDPKINQASTSDKPSLVTQAVQVSNKAEEFRKYIEVEVLQIIKDLAEKGTVTQERIQEIAKLTLELIKPGMNLEKLYENAVKLDDQFSELAPLVFKVMNQYEEKYEKKAVGVVSAMIKNGQYDQAQAMVKKVLKFKIEN